MSKPAILTRSEAMSVKSAGDTLAVCEIQTAVGGEAGCYYEPTHMGAVESELGVEEKST